VLTWIHSYKHGVIPQLIDSSLLRSVRTEILENLSFTPKETDIYKIHQSGDLANLDGLDDSSLKLLPSLLTLRNALYSSSFREYLSSITNAGPLSGKKTDMAINIYTPGCHLLCHDDVIGSRRVSYILYLIDPDHAWKPKYGGALRLFPVKEFKGMNQKKTLVPLQDHAIVIPPTWNQLSFFAVQPGQSFHDVEEVYGQENAKKTEQPLRIAISGWYHIPQDGEAGFVEGLEEQLATESSLTQLQSRENIEHDRPQPNPKPYPSEVSKTEDGNDEYMDSEILTVEDCDFLIRFISPIYLIPETLSELQAGFEDASALRMDSFLNPVFSEQLKTWIAAQPETVKRNTNKIERAGFWSVASPPHKHRYLYTLASTPDPENQNLLAFNSKPASPHKELLRVLLPSLAFKKWIYLATGLRLVNHDFRGRRFRRGYDYSMGIPYEEEEPKLEMTLGITPTSGWEKDMGDTDDDAEAASKGDSDRSSAGKRTKKQPAAEPASAGSGSKGPCHDADEPKEDEYEDNVGGYELYMASDAVGSRSPATASTRTSSAATSSMDSESDTDSSTEIEDAPTRRHRPQPTRRPQTRAQTQRAREPKPAAADPAVYQSAAAEGEDDGILFSMAAGWNRLSLVLRDKGVMRFVKYVSARAKGDRWDVVGEWAIENQDEEEGGDEEHGR
jgi:Rps23 Pro-64 3,4-dihydroxylase Tpa1-like proline 4-hydroxylase